MSSNFATLVCCLAFYSAIGYGLAKDPETGDSSLLTISEPAEEPTRIRRFVVDKSAGSSWPPTPSPFNPNPPSYPFNPSSQPNNFRFRRFIDTTSRPIRPLILPLSTLPPFNPRYPSQQDNFRFRRSPQDQKPWEVNPDLSRVKKHGENHDVEAGWGQTIRGPNKHSKTWHVDGSARW